MNGDRYDLFRGEFIHKTKESRHCNCDDQSIRKEDDFSKIPKNRKSHVPHADLKRHTQSLEFKLEK